MSVVYNPLSERFLTIATVKTKNGQKDVRIVLDVRFNVFYTLDDDGNFTIISDFPEPLNFRFIDKKDDFPDAIAGVITLEDDYTYFITRIIDLSGDRLEGGFNTVIIGGSSENCGLQSTGLFGTALLSSLYSLPMRNIHIKADVALNLQGDGVTTAINWFGVNLLNCNSGGTIADYTNLIWTDCALLDSGGITFDGTFGSICFNSCFFNRSRGVTALTIASSAIITRRFRIIYSSFVTILGETSINFDVAATIPTEAYILDTVNFSGGGTYLAGLNQTSLKSLFINCNGIENTSNVGHYRLIANATPTTFSVSNTYGLVQGTTVAAYGNSPKWVHTNGRLTYIGQQTQDFYISGVVILEPAGNNQTYAVTFGINGVPDNTEAVEFRTANSGQPYSITGIGIAPFSNGDYIELFLKNLNTTTAATITDFNVIIQKIRN